MSILGTKAETLKSLRGALNYSVVPDLKYFTYREWVYDRAAVLRQVKRYFRNSKLAVRSSSLGEDTSQTSNAGAYLSLIGILCVPEKIAVAIDKVFASYENINGVVNDLDQVLIQVCVGNVSLSGVIFTRNIDDGAPYYVCSYDDETGKTDTVTAGTNVSKTVYMHSSVEDYQIKSDRLKRIIKFTREIEDKFNSIPLDIEFVIDANNVVHLLQARPIATMYRWKQDANERVINFIRRSADFIESTNKREIGFVGQSRILANMSDWNPAELLGQIAKPLAISLFRKLISNVVWHTARSDMGYRKIPECDLIVEIYGRTYVDTRRSFNSLLPSSLKGSVCEKLVDYWNDKLLSNPHLQDKIEFEIIYSHSFFGSECEIECDLKTVLEAKELKEFLFSLKSLTREIVSIAPSSTLVTSERAIESLSQYDFREFSAKADSGVKVQHLRHLLNNKAKFGSYHFARLARHAFVAEGILRSMVRSSLIKDERLQDFKRSIVTIASKYTSDVQKVVNGQKDKSAFLKEFGHLRPSTFDINSPAYHQRPEIFNFTSTPNTHLISDGNFELSADERLKIEKALMKTDFTEIRSADELLEYCKRAIAGREFSKFQFTKFLSKALDELLDWGAEVGLSASELSYIEIDEFLKRIDQLFFTDGIASLKAISERRRQNYQSFNEFKLTFLLSSPLDLIVAPVQRSQPTFITNICCTHRVVTLNATSSPNINLHSKIVCIESADPGFDWIFSHGVAGLITKYGGANSHMAIRCAELNVPAAIGCGELLFDKIVTSRHVTLDCGNNTIKTF